MEFVTNACTFNFVEFVIWIIIEPAEYNSYCHYIVMVDTPHAPHTWHHTSITTFDSELNLQEG